MFRTHHHLRRWPHHLPALPDVLMNRAKPARHQDKGQEEQRRRVVEEVAVVELSPRLDG